MVEDRPAVLLLTRVALGRVELLERDDAGKDQALPGHNTAVAKRGHTRVPREISRTRIQSHNEVVKYKDRNATYPEFIVHFVMRRSEA